MMSTSLKKIVLFLLLSLFLVMFLSAGTYYVEWIPGDYFSNDEVLRYKINNGAWNIVEDKNIPITSVVYHKSNVLNIETSTDGVEWDNSIDSKLNVINKNDSDNYKVSWKWNAVPGTKSVRYRENNGQWIEMSNSSTGIVEDVNLNNLSIITVQSSVDGSSWEGLTKGIVVAEKQTPPRTRKMMLSILGGTEFEDVYFITSKTKLRSNIGYGAKVTLSLPITSTFSLSFDNQLSKYTLGRFNYLQYDPTIKLRFESYNEKGLSPYVMLGGGVSIVVRDNKSYYYPLLSVDLGFDLWFSKAFAISVNGCGSATIQSDKILNPDSKIDSIGLHASGSIGFTYAICKKGETK